MVGHDIYGFDQLHYLWAKATQAWAQGQPCVYDTRDVSVAMPLPNLLLKPLTYLLVIGQGIKLKYGHWWYFMSRLMLSCLYGGHSKGLIYHHLGHLKFASNICKWSQIEMMSFLIHKWIAKSRLHICVIGGKIKLKYVHRWYFCHS